MCVWGGGGGVLFSHRAAQDSVLILIIPTPDKSGTYCLYLDQFRSLNTDASSLQQINLISNQSRLTETLSDWPFSCSKARVRLSPWLSVFMYAEGCEMVTDENVLWWNVLSISVIIFKEQLFLV